MARPEERCWFTQRTGYLPGGDFVALVWADKQDNVKGMLGFDTFKPNSCQAHLALDAPHVGRALFRGGAAWIFRTRGLVLGSVVATNRACLSAAKRIGFVETHRVTDGWAAGVDLVSLELRKENCKWLPQVAGKKAA